MTGYDLLTGPQQMALEAIGFFDLAMLLVRQGDMAGAAFYHRSALRGLDQAIAAARKHQDQQSWVHGLIHHEDIDVHNAAVKYARWK